MEIRQSNYESTLREWSAFCCSRTSLLSNSHRFRSSWGRQKKQMVEIPLGFHVFIPTRSRERAMQLATYHQYHLTFLLVQSTQKNIGLDGRTLDTFDQTKVHENPLLAEEMLDTINGNRVRILLKFLTPNSDFLERFPPKIFNRVSFQVNV